MIGFSLAQKYASKWKTGTSDVEQTVSLEGHSLNSSWTNMISTSALMSQIKYFNQEREIWQLSFC